MFTFLFGRSGSGKTEYLILIILNDLGSFVITDNRQIVPNLT